MLGCLLLVNPRYEIQLFASDMPGTALTIAAAVFTGLAALAAYSILGLANAVAERNSWSQSRSLIPLLLVGIAVSVLCTLPTLLLVTLGPAFVALTRINAP